MVRVNGMVGLYGVVGSRGWWESKEWFGFRGGGSSG